MGSYNIESNNRTDVSPTLELCDRYNNNIRSSKPPVLLLFKCRENFAMVTMLFPDGEMRIRRVYYKVVGFPIDRLVESQRCCLEDEPTLLFAL